MNLIDRAVSGFKRGAKKVKRMATLDNANKLFHGTNRAFNNIGGYANLGSDIIQGYGPLLLTTPQEKEVANNVMGVLNRVGRLAN